VGTDKYHIQVSHHLRVGKNALNEYGQYAIYLAILNHGAIDMFSVCKTELLYLQWQTNSKSYVIY